MRGVMRASVFALVAILHLIFPISSASLLPRSQVCANDGSTIAGTLYHRRDVPIPSLNLRTSDPRCLPQSQCIWCGAGTRTYLIIRFLTLFREGSTNSPLLLSMLRDAIIAINSHIRQYGDGPIEGGVFRFTDYGVRWVSFNANNHQQTWGVMGIAIEAFTQYVIQHGTYGAVTFEIYDGENQVGQGALQLVGSN